MRNSIRFVGLAAVVFAAASCGDVIRNGRAPMILVLNSLQGASGGGHAANQFGPTLLSDVQVLLTSPSPCAPTSPCPTVFDDQGQAVMSLAPKDLAVTPTTNNQVTITRYHVEYTRADGRNTPGVDVPYAFDGAVTVLIPPAGTANVGFELVRHTAKEEAPLVQLINNPQIISVIAKVTFYGTDQVGNAVTVTGTISINFGNFGDA